MDLKEAKTEAKYKAMDALSRYKFMMFGYWAAMWVHLNKLDEHKDPNPFQGVVLMARKLKEGFF